MKKSLVACACIAAFANPAAALNVALTNDDGWQAPGIWAMKYALEAAGHTVTLAAPLTDQSGSSMALDLESLAVTKQADRVYSVALWRDKTIAAKPADSAYMAISIAQESGSPPDLLISGINTSANIGAVALLSGTVGAAVHSVSSPMNGPVPAIAVGTDVPRCDPACQWAHYVVVADFVSRFVGHLQTKPGFLASEAGLLPAGVGLILSHPGTSAIKGVRIAVESDSILSSGVKVSGGFKCATPCSTLPVAATGKSSPVLQADGTPEGANSDLAYYTAGYVTIVPVVANLTASNPLRFKSVLAGFAQ